MRKCTHTPEVQEGAGDQTQRAGARWCGKPAAAAGACLKPACAGSRVLVGTLDEYGPVDLALGVAGRTAKLQLKATGLSAGRVRLGAGGSRGTPSRVRTKD